MDKLEALVREKAKSELFDEDGALDEEEDDFELEDFGDEV